MKRFFTIVICVCLSQISFAQTSMHGKVTDAATGAPLGGATIFDSRTSQTIQTATNGQFILENDGTPDTLTISSIGYQRREVVLQAGLFLIIPLAASFTGLNEVIVSADRNLIRRTEAPMAISVLSKATLEETKATRLDQLLNKVPGAFMVDLGNEQHSMAIRQPLGYSNLYLYLEDGIPIRTVGDFNHNALIEINQASLGRIEVLKGPASSIYGSEAVGGAVNFITQAPTSEFSGKIQLEAGSFGYKRTDLAIGQTFGKWGVFASGYLTRQDQSESQHNDFNKAAWTARVDGNMSDKTKWSTTLDYIHYHTDQKGGLDSAHFYNKDYSSFYRFTYRKVNALRIKSTLSHQWNEQNNTSLTLFYRHSSIGQNPFYSIGDDADDPRKANGQINTDAFHSYGAVVQHTKTFQILQGKWVSGISLDYSPATYIAHYISVDKNAGGVYENYSPSDSLLTDYRVGLLNSAFYTQLEFTVAKGLKVTGTARYDRLDYNFDNHLAPGAYTGAPDSKDHFDHVSPKLGVTYDLGKGRGVYSNYSVGFAPPNITDLYTGVQVPVLKPAAYRNYEVGGWVPFTNNKGYAELSLYKMDGLNEIISVRLPDGTYINQNAGQTRHTGLEWNVHYALLPDLLVRLGGTFADHQYVDFVQQGKDYSGNQMGQAPHRLVNAEITWKTPFLKGLRISAEWQSVGKYYTDPANTSIYKGFNVFNIRTGYKLKGMEVWINCINAGNDIYATTVEKSAYGVSYRPGQLRTFNVGLAYHFGQL